MKCKLHTDMWDDLGKVYSVRSLYIKQETTAVTLNLVLEDGTEVTRVVPQNQIEWIT